MSAFKQKLARIGATAGVLAASTAAIFAAGGATAGSALAAPPNCVAGPGIVLQGEGSTLQNVAQTEWTKIYNEKCPTASDYNFKYTGTGSGAALEAFGYTTTAGTIKTGEAYVGTDEAPEKSQIEHVEEKHSGVVPVIIPVAQTSIAILAHPPTGCSFESGKGITWKDLNKIFAGKALQWSEIGGTTGCGTKTITRVVRSDGSGTTFQFKNYLSVLEGPSPGKEGIGPGEIETNKEGATHACATKTWSAIRKNGGEPNLNIRWPETFNSTTGKGCSGNGTLSPIVTEKGGGEIVKEVKNTEGTIGYAAYSDVVGGTATSFAVPLENLNSEGVHYGSPGVSTSPNEANCGGRIYTVPSETNGLAQDWSAVFGAKPNVGSEGNFYPLCTLTYDLSWHGKTAGTSGYKEAGYGTTGATIGSAVKDYLLKYVLEPTLGQSVLNSKGYQTFPKEKGATHEVLKAAVVAAEQIN
jgi:ABC-type phosphate transport system substrate-binding protein